MATKVLSVTVNRVEDSEALTGWSSRGGGAGAAAEAPLAYQGTNTVNRKISSSTGAGFQYDPIDDGGSAVDMTATGNTTWMTKFIVSDAGGLRANDGVRIIIGDGVNEYAFVTAGSDCPKAAYSSYLLRTATIILPVNPNISGYRDATHSDTNGSVTLTAVDQFGIDAEFANGTAKSENVGLDAIDLGTGLTIERGDSTDPDCVWQDFVDYDEGTVNNRWGFASSLFGEIFTFFGRFEIGQNDTVTEFDDTGATILWPDGLFAAGFSSVQASLEFTGTTINDGSTHTSLGTTNIEDTRADWTWLGTSGTGTASHTINNFRNYTMTSAVTLDGANIQIADLTQANGTIQNSTVRCNSASGVAVCNDADFTNLSNVTFSQTGSGHAIEITSPGSYTLDALTFSGFGTTGSNDAAIYNNSGGAVTLNITNNGSTPTYRNGTSATTTVANAVPITLTGLVANSRVYIENTTDSVVLFNEIETTTTFADSVDYTADKALLIRVRNASGATKYKAFETTGTLTSSGFTLNVNQIVDE